MRESENIDQKLDSIRGKLGQLDAAYRELKSKGLNDGYNETLKEGYLVKAGKITESILKYICRNENITPATRSRGGIDERRPVMLNDLIQALKEKAILDDDILHHIDNIKKWRNRSVHDITSELNPHEVIAPSTIESVHDSFDSFIQWFFKIYLKGEVPEWIAKSSPGALDNDLPHLGSQGKLSGSKIFNPDFPISKPKRKSRLGGILKFIAVVTLLGCASFVAYTLLLEDEPPISTGNKSRDKVYNLLERYLAICNTDTFNARAYFTDTVKQYYLLYNQTPEQIKRDPSKKDFQVPESLIDKASLQIRSEADGIAYWQFWSDFTCFRPSHNKYTKSHVLMEFGINDEMKICSIRQLELNKIY